MLSRLDLVGDLFTLHKLGLYLQCTGKYSLLFVQLLQTFTNYIAVLLLYYLLTNIGGFATFLIFSVNYFIAIVYVFVFMNI